MSIEAAPQTARPSIQLNGRNVTAMIARKSIFGLLILCALVAGAFATQASAASKGTTMFTCKGVTAGTGHFKGGHCKTTDAGTGEGANWEHVAVAQNETTEITGTSENTEGVCQSWTLGSLQAGQQMEVTSACAHTLASNNGEKSWATNKVNAETGEHYIEGEAWVAFTEVIVTKPAEKGCKIKSGSITSNKIKFTTLGLGDEFKIESAVAGKPLVAWEMEGCTIAALNGKYETSGSVKVPVNGSTVSATEAGTTAQGTLKLRGQTAGAAGEMTVKGKASKDESDTALSVTTVETP